MLTIATFNLYNLGANVPPPRLERLAHIIVNDLGGPDILTVQEITATAGATAYGGRVPALDVYRMLIQGIMYAGGPHYAVREVAPLANRDGGQAGRNIRIGFLFNPRRVGFEDRGAASPESATGLRIIHGRPSLTLNPGRIAPQDSAFEGDQRCHWVPSRKALVGEFQYGDKNVFVIGCHLKSQRAVNRREEMYAKKQRHAQAAVIYQFAANILKCAPCAHVVVLGDMNDVTGSKTLDILKGHFLKNLLENLPEELRYTRYHGSQRQTLDHVLVSHSLFHGARVRIPHVTSEDPSPYRASDHDPVLATLPI